MNGDALLEVLELGKPVKSGAVIGQFDQPPQPGPFTALLRDGRTIIATAEGIALVGQERSLVVPARVHEGHVTRGDPLEVEGNLVVCGDALSGSKIRATGAVGIRGGAVNAHVEAGRSTVIGGGCSNSVIEVGATGRQYQATLTRIRALEESLQRLQAVIRQLKSNPAFRAIDIEEKLTPLLYILVERNFASFPLQIAEAIRQCHKQVHRGELFTELASLLERRFKGATLFTVRVEEIAEAARLSAAAAGALADPGNTDHHLRIRQRVERCTLTASGRIELLAEECIDSQLQAGTATRIDGQLRGSQVSAGTLIDADLVMAGCELRVEPSGQIVTTAMQPHTTLQIGGESLRTERLMTAVAVQASHGKLTIRQREEVCGSV